MQHIDVIILGYCSIIIAIILCHALYITMIIVFLGYIYECRLGLSESCYENGLGG